MVAAGLSSCSFHICHYLWSYRIATRPYIGLRAFGPCHWVLSYEIDGRVLQRSAWIRALDKGIYPIQCLENLPCQDGAVFAVYTTGTFHLATRTWFPVTVDMVCILPTGDTNYSLRLERLLRQSIYHHDGLFDFASIVTKGNVTFLSKDHWYCLLNQSGSADDSWQIRTALPRSTK